MRLTNLKIAVVHDWFLVKGGAEKVLKEILECFPKADVYSLLNGFNRELGNDIVHSKPVNVSFLQRFPFANKYHRYLLPLYTRAIESLNLKKYDLIISSSHAVAKGVRTYPHQVHVCYCHTPVRYAWDLKSEYLSHVKRSVLRKLASWQLEKLRNWDLNSAPNVTTYIANSQYVSKRIKNNYNRSSTVVYPPVDTEYFQPNGVKVEEREHYISISRLVPYKRLDLVLEAFRNLPHLKLKMIGSGPEFEKLKALAPSNADLMGFVSDEALKKELQRSKALILAADEDFGMTSLEAQACGIPVIALKRGGYLETVIDNHTGLFFEDQTKEALMTAILEFESRRDQFRPDTARSNALRFSKETFREQFTSIVEDNVKEL